MKEQVKINDYETVANFLMSGNKKDVKLFVEQLNWEKFTEDCCEFMDIKFIRKYKDYISWEMYCSNAELSEDFIREFADYVDWGWISANESLSDDFVEEMADYIEWDTLCTYKYLSEGFIRRFKDYVDWECLMNGDYDFSDEFRAEFKEYLEEVE